MNGIRIKLACPICHDPIEEGKDQVVIMDGKRAHLCQRCSKIAAVVLNHEKLSFSPGELPGLSFVPGA